MNSMQADKTKLNEQVSTRLQNESWEAVSLETEAK